MRTWNKRGGKRVRKQSENELKAEQEVDRWRNRREMPRKPRIHLSHPEKTSARKEGSAQLLDEVKWGRNQG